MKLLQILAFSIIGLYFFVTVILYFLQTRFIFYPGRLAKDFRFKLGETGEEIFITTEDHERINALFYKGTRDEVILYFHGNAGDLSGWQFVAEDFVQFNYSILLIDYRGYGKSTGTISERGFYTDAASAYNFLIAEKGFDPTDIIVYGRSIGTGVAVDLAARHTVKGLVLESPYTSLGDLADSKVPFFFPSVYLRFSFNNLKKINAVKCPLIVIHGANDDLIPSSHGEFLYQRFEGKKKLILIAGAAHNDMNAFEDYQYFLIETLPSFF